MSDKRPFDAAACDRLATRASAGDAKARSELIELLWPVWQQMIRSSRSMGSMIKSEDHVQNVVAVLVGKIGSEDGRALGLHAAWRLRHPDKTFDDWMRIVTANAVRDYVREQLGVTLMDDDGQKMPSVKRMLNEFAHSKPLEALGARPPMTAAQTARQLLEFAKAHLPAEQYEALTLWLEGADFDEIAGELGASDPEAGRKLVRAAIAALRREFSA